jgi:hypothetical protein
MSKRVIKYVVIVWGEGHEVGSLKEAEDKLKRHEQSDFAPSYIVRREFSQSGKLLEEIMVG